MKNILPPRLLIILSLCVLVLQACEKTPAPDANADAQANAQADPQVNARTREDKNIDVTALADRYYAITMERQP